MGIMNYIRKGKQDRSARFADHVLLNRPVVNLFLGDFDPLEINCLKDMFESRICSSDRALYANLIMGESTNIETTKEVHTIFLGLNPENIAYDETGRVALHEHLANHPVLDNVLRSYGGDVFNKVSVYEFQYKGQIRVNLLIKAQDLAAAALDIVIERVKSIWEEFFPEDIMIDVYCLLDERQTMEYADERKAFSYKTVFALSELAARDNLLNMVYLLSNINSKGVLKPNNAMELIAPIALMEMIKNGKTNGDSHHKLLYQDARFKSISVNKNNSFCSFGRLQFGKPDEIIELIIYKQLLQGLYGNMLNIDRDDLRTRIDLSQNRLDSLFVKHFGSNSLGNDSAFYSIVKNPNFQVSSLIGMSNKEAINQLFGGNLDLFFQLNYYKGYQDKAEEVIQDEILNLKNSLEQLYKQNSYSIYEVANLLGEDEVITNTLNKLLSQNTDNKNAQQMLFAKWKEANADASDLKTEIKGIKEPAVIYRLAGEYISLQNKALISEFNLDMIRGYKLSIGELREKYHKSILTLDEAKEELDRFIHMQLEEGLPLQTGNCVNYYSQIVSQLITGRYKMEYEILIDSINQAISFGELTQEKLYLFLHQFSDKYIVKEKVFEDTFTVEMVKRLMNFEYEGKLMASQEDIYHAAYQTITDQLQYNIKIVETNVENNQLNKEICFIVDTYNEFIDYVIEKLNQYQNHYKINIFHEKDGSSMDILYLEGGFGPNQYGAMNTWQKSLDRISKKSTDVKEGGQPNGISDYSTRK